METFKIFSKKYVLKKKVSEKNKFTKSHYYIQNFFFPTQKTIFKYAVYKTGSQVCIHTHYLDDKNTLVLFACMWFQIRQFLPSISLYEHDNPIMCPLPNKVEFS